jgi:hypothetical protein
MNDSWFRADRKIELYEDFRFDDKIYELQNDVRHNRRQRLKNRADERQNCFFVRQDHENVFVVQLTSFEQKIKQVCKLNKTLYDLKQSSRI